MATEYIKESRFGKIVGVLIVVALVLLVVSGCRRLFIGTFKGGNNSEDSAKQAKEKEQVKGVEVEEKKEKQERIYKNDSCGVEFEYPAEWEYEEGKNSFIHDDFGKVNLSCEDVENIPETGEQLEIGKILGNLETKANYKKVVVNLPGGELEWLMEGEAKAVEEMAKLVEFARMPVR